MNLPIVGYIEVNDWGGFTVKWVDDVYYKGGWHWTYYPSDPRDARSFFKRLMGLP